MKSKTTFLTERYKDCFIQSHYDEDGRREQITVKVGNEPNVKVKSYTSAKRVITMTLNKKNNDTRSK